ncbi:hypothetical protein K239x_06930 [Planctomycetes bacterium K23_9]|uniref:Uncharacterized protein n=1 Tax=Stieleria marina TaxID=1930275 RepID=A0A517NNQ0_9BACT|nr:hypothetical protein K239x_06930 [Planctomycetes bacterium K23_9]
MALLLSRREETRVRVDLSNPKKQPPEQQCFGGCFGFEAGVLRVKQKAVR